MKSILVIGSQWGDEGKGKITNIFSSKADIVVRYQGGNNAGHTVKFNGLEFHLQTIPSGIFNKNTLNINVRISSNDRDGKKIADIPSSMISYAEYLLLNNTTLLEIQKADIEDLVYTSKELQLMTIGLAVREADTGYEIYARWESGSSQSYEIVNYLIF